LADEVVSMPMVLVMVQLVAPEAEDLVMVGLETQD
jgi:hypothetical protein